MEEALGSSDGGQSEGHHPVNGFQNGFEDDNDVERGGGIVGGLAGLIQDHHVGGFHGRGVVSESHQKVEEHKYNLRIDKVDLFPHGVGDHIGAWGQGGGVFAEGEFDIFLGEGGRGWVFSLGVLSRAGVLRAEKVIEKRMVDRDWVRGVGQGGEPGGFSWADQLLGRTDVVGGGLRKEVGPVGGFSSFDSLKIAELGLSCNEGGVRGPEFFGSAGGFRELPSESGQEWGPPSFRPCGWV